MKTFTITEQQLQEIDQRLSAISTRGQDSVHMVGVFAILAKIAQPAEQAPTDGENVELFDKPEQEAA